MREMVTQLLMVFVLRVISLSQSGQLYDEDLAPGEVREAPTENFFAAEGVESNVGKQKQAVVLVIDKSGSMREGHKLLMQRSHQYRNKGPKAFFAKVLNEQITANLPR